MAVESNIHPWIGPILLVTGLGALYVSSHLAVASLSAGASGTPGRRAWGYWMPIAIVVLAAMAVGEPNLALSVIFGTCVASLCLVGGIVIALSPPLATQPGWRTAWLFVLPAALLTLLAGFGAHLRPMHAMAMLLEGLAVLGVWRANPTNPTTVQTATSEPQTASANPPPARSALKRALLLLGALALAVAGAWIAVRAVVRATDVVYTATPGLLGAAALSPLLVLPMIGGGLSQASRGEGWSAVGTHVGLTLLNLCLLLPAAILLWYFVPPAWSWVAHLLDAATPVIDYSAVRPLNYPLAVWRVDNVVLIALGFLLVPVGLGRWTLKWYEGMAMIVAYSAYLMVVMIFGLRAGGAG